jgi:hypothetical protein
MLQHISGITPQWKIKMAKYDVFISHSAKDKGFVRRLRTDLEVYGYKVWLDEMHLAVGSALYPGLEDAIRNSRFLAAVYSRNSLATPWVARERLFAAAEGIPVIPILLDNDGLTDELSGQIYADFRESNDAHIYYRAFHDVLRVLGTAINPPDELPIYSNGLTPGWLNSSWDATCVKQYVMEDSGKICFRADLRPFGGIAFLFRSGITTSPFACLKFSLHGGKAGGQALKVYFNDRIGNGILNQVPLQSLTSNRWESLCISLADLDAESTIIFKVNWSHASGEINGPIHLADVCFIKC